MWVHHGRTGLGMGRLTTISGVFEDQIEGVAIEKGLLVGVVSFMKWSERKVPVVFCSVCVTPVFFSLFAMNELRAFSSNPFIHHVHVVPPFIPTSPPFIIAYLAVNTTINDEIDIQAGFKGLEPFMRWCRQLF